MERRRAAAVVSLVIGLLLVGVGPAQAATYPLKSVTWGAWTLYSQQESNWCWAAATKMLIRKRLGSAAPSECTIVNRAKGTTTCANVTGTFDDMGDAVNYHGFNTARGLARPLFSTIRESTVAGYGIYARVVWSSGGNVGHIAPLIGSTADEKVYITRIRTTAVSGSWITYDQFAKGTAGLGAAYSPSGGYFKG